MKKFQTKLKKSILKWLLNGTHFSNSGLTISYNDLDNSSITVDVGFMVLNTWDLPEGYSVTITRGPKV